MMNKSKITTEQYNQVIDAIRDGIQATRHHKKATTRVVDAIKAQLAKAFPDSKDSFCVVLYGEYGTAEKLKIWGGSDLIHFDDRIVVYGRNNMDAVTDKVSWADGLLNGLRVNDTRDYQERERDEVALAPLFATYEHDIELLEARIKDIRENALKAIAQLPIPKGATLRTESMFWTNPSNFARTKYPRLFAKQ
jgi:hypothetical protein